ncbi:hypothetical protein [Prosthecobacter sp.]
MLNSCEGWQSACWHGGARGHWQREAAREPGTGNSLTKDAQVRMCDQLEAPIQQSRIKLDSIFARHDTRHVVAGIELELPGRQALYWIEMDLLKQGL